MVKRVDDKGGIYHEPPYKPQEQLEIVRRANGGVVAFSRPCPRPTAPKNR